METIEYDEENEVCIIMSKADIENSYNEISMILKNLPAMPHSFQSDDWPSLFKWKEFFYYMMEFSK